MPLQTLPLDLSIPNPPVFPTTQGGQVILAGPQDPPNKPKIVWAQNVLPTEYGLCSVDYATYVNDLESNAGDQADLIRVYTIWDQTSEKATLYFYANGNHLVLDPTTKTWSVQETGGITTRPISIGYVRGKSYVYDGVKIYKFDADFAAMTEDSVTGITITDMLGFTSALDYIIAWDEDTIYWSAPGIPGEFRPVVSNLLTGAGSSRIIELVGHIQYCIRISGGFIIYGSINIVSARYSGNSHNPWIFRGLEASAGITRLDGVHASDSSTSHFAFTTEGLKEVNINKCENVFPELSKMLLGWTYYTSDGDGTFTKVESASGSDLRPLAVKCAYIGDKYFCISFGASTGTSFPFILVYDTGLQQWGMLKVDHVDVFELIDVYTISGTSSGDTGHGKIGVLDPSGKVYSVQPTQNESKMDNAFTSTSEVVWREIRVTRNRTSDLNRVELTGYMDLASDSTYDVKVMSFFDSTAGIAEVDFDNYPSGSKVFIGDSGGYHHQLRIAGKFCLTSGVIDLSVKGTH